MKSKTIILACFTLLIFACGKNGDVGPQGADGEPGSSGEPGTSANVWSYVYTSRNGRINFEDIHSVETYFKLASI